MHVSHPQPSRGRRHDGEGDHEYESHGLDPDDDGCRRHEEQNRRDGPPGVSGHRREDWIEDEKCQPTPGECRYSDRDESEDEDDDVVLSRQSGRVAEEVGVDPLTVGQGGLGDDAQPDHATAVKKCQADCHRRVDTHTGVGADDVGQQGRER